MNRLLPLLVLVLLISCGQAPPPAVASGWDQAVAANYPIILDCRTAKEFAGGHVAGAINLPYDQINTASMQAVGVTHSQPIIVHCAAGVRSARALRTLKKLGYLHVRDLADPTQTQAWIDANPRP